MTTQIKSASFSNTHGGARLNVSLSTGRTMCAKMLQSDVKMFLKKEIRLTQLIKKYFRINNEGVVSYTNPSK